jgi:hypothetical protein
MAFAGRHDAGKLGLGKCSTHRVKPLPAFDANSKQIDPTDYETNYLEHKF